MPRSPRSSKRSPLANSRRGPGGSDVKLKLVADPSQPVHGFTMRFSESTEPLEIEVAAADRRGYYYAAASLRQMLSREDGQLTLRHSMIETDFPLWTEPCVSDIMKNGTFDNLLTLAHYKIAGICLRTEGDWQDEKWMDEMAPVLADIKRAADLDLCDVIVQMHLFPKAHRRMNLADKDDVELIINRVRNFAASGVKNRDDRG